MPLVFSHWLGFCRTNRATISHGYKSDYILPCHRVISQSEGWLGGLWTTTQMNANEIEFSVREKAELPFTFLHC
jgi:hypothetical protein